MQLSALAKLVLTKKSLFLIILFVCGQLAVTKSSCLPSACSEQTDSDQLAFDKVFWIKVCVSSFPGPGGRGEWSLSNRGHLGAEEPPAGRGERGMKIHIHTKGLDFFGRVKTRG